MKKVLFFYISFLIFIFGCESSKKVVELKKYYNYKYDTIVRVFEGDYEKGYRDGMDLIINDDIVYETYNYCRNDELKILDHSNQKSYSFPFYNPNCRVIYNSIKKENNDLYLVSTDNKISVYCEGKNKSEIVFDLMNLEQFHKSGMTVEWKKSGSNQYVNVPNDILYFRVNQNYNDKKGKYSKMDANFPAFAKYNLKTNDLQFFGKLPYFEVYQQYGFLSYYFDLFKGDTIITCSSIEGSIEIINTISGQITKKFAKSSFDTKPIQKIKYPKDKRDINNLKMNHFLVSPHYEPLFFNPYTNLYYRIFHPRMNELNDEGLMNTNQDKICVLMVFNNNLEIIDEEILPIKGNLILNLYPSHDGIEIYLPEISQKNSKKAELKFLKIRHLKK